MFYQNSLDTKGKVYFASKSWAAATERSLLNFSLQLCNDRYNSMHGVDEEDLKRIKNEKVVKRVGGIYDKRDEIGQDYGYLFWEGIQSLCKNSTQYLIKWIASFRMAENVIARGKLKHPGENPVKLRRRGRGKGKNGVRGRPGPGAS